MILVLTGTQNFSFRRLIDEVVELVNLNIIQEKVIIQSGVTKIIKDPINPSKNLMIYDFIERKKMENYIDEADLIITHGGTSSIISALKKEKKVIVVPRRKKYGEHVDDHQLEIVEYFNEKEYIKSTENINELKELILNIHNFKLKKYREEKSMIYQEILLDLERL